MNQEEKNLILAMTELSSELELEVAQSITGKLAWMEKIDPSLKPLRRHLIDLIVKYEMKHWQDASAVTNEQIKQSNLAEALVKLMHFEPSAQVIQEDDEDDGKHDLPFDLH